MTVGGGSVGTDPAYVLDAFCRAALDAAGGTRELTDQVTRGLRAAYDASMLFLVTGTAAPLEELQRLVAGTPADLWASVWRAAAGEAAGLAEYAGRPIVTLGELGQLPVAMSEVIR